MSDQCDSTVWIVTPVKGVSLARPENVLGGNLSLVRADDQLLAARSELFLSKVQFTDVGNAGWFLVLTIPESSFAPVNVPEAVERLLDALMAFQIVKPVGTLGLIFGGVEHEGTLRWQTTNDRRWGMVAGPWAQLRTFDDSLFDKVLAIADRVREAMVGSNIAVKNAVHLLQLSLEHPHPYISCLLAVTGIEAVLNSNDRWDFEKKLCDLLGPSSLAFPDWNSPQFPALKYTVKDLAVHLYTLRSKIAHGANLVTAAQDKNSPVDLSAFREYIPESDPVRYAALLGESSIYLLGRVLQTVV